MDVETLEAALNRLAPALASGGQQVTGLTRLSGGASQETWAFQVRGSHPEPRDLILRRRPDGIAPTEDSTALPLSTEATLITAAAKVGAPVPEIVHVAQQDDGVGEAYVMARVEGETLGRRIVRDAAFAAVRPQLARRCGEVLGRIHAVPLEGLPPLRTSDAEDELDRYEQVYRASGAARPVFEVAFRRLRERAPAAAAPTLVHGDFRNGNLMVSPERGLAAVLDWELAHIGDPAMDLGWLCVNSWRFGEHTRPVGGFGAYEDLLAGYASVAGAAPALEQVLYWQMLGSLKWGIMCLTMYGIYASGADPSVERAMIGRRVSETEIDLIGLLEPTA